MSGSQSYITRNRPPRVHVTYEGYTGGAMKMVELPFIALVWADLSGKNASELQPVDERKAIDISADNFDQVLSSQKPRVSFAIDNHLTGEGGDDKMPIDITFEKMSDFEPGEVARKVEPLKKLLEARQTLDNLLGVIGGKPQAEALFEKLRESPDLLNSLLEQAQSEVPSDSEEEKGE